MILPPTVPRIAGSATLTTSVASSASPPRDSRPRKGFGIIGGEYLRGCGCIVRNALSVRDALLAFDDFMALYEEKYPKACVCLRKDKDVLFTGYDFRQPTEIEASPKVKHLRTTNPIESTFATVRHRMRQTKGCGSRQATLPIVYKLGRQAEKRWRRLDGSRFIGKVLRGDRFVGDTEQADARLVA